MQRWIIDERRRIMKDCNNSPKPKTPESMPNKTSSTAPTSPTAKDSYSKLPINMQKPITLSRIRVFLWLISMSS